MSVTPRRPRRLYKKKKLFQITNSSDRVIKMKFLVFIFAMAMGWGLETSDLRSKRGWVASIISWSSVPGILIPEIQEPIPDFWDNHWDRLIKKWAYDRFSRKSAYQSGIGNENGVNFGKPKFSWSAGIWGLEIYQLTLVLYPKITTLYEKRNKVYYKNLKDVFSEPISHLNFDYIFTFVDFRHCRLSKPDAQKIWNFWWNMYIWALIWSINIFLYSAI